jgi:hypothetical protein
MYLPQCKALGLQFVLFLKCIQMLNCTAYKLPTPFCKKAKAKIVHIPNIVLNLLN